MFSTRLTVWISVFLLVLSSIFAIGVFEDDGSFTFYTNKQDPQINVSLQSITEEVRVISANLTLNEHEATLSINQKLKIGEKGSFSFFKKDFLVTKAFNETDTIFFKLLALGVDDKKIQTIAGSDPTEFKIKVDLTKPTLLFPLQNEVQVLDNQGGDFRIEADEKLQSVKLVLNNQIIGERKINSQFKNNFFQSTSFTKEELNVAEGANTILVELTDLSGNTVSFNRSIFLVGEPIQVELLTKKNNSNLNYFFDKEQANLFGSTIFTSEPSFTLQVKTSKVASCFFSDSLLNFEEIQGVETKEKLQSSDGITHSITVDTSKTKRFWLACHGPAGFEDTVYLSESMALGQKLISVEKYAGKELQILRSEPQSLITKMPTSVLLETNEKAFCSLRINGEEEQKLSSTNFLLHNSSLFTKDAGTFTLELSCTDRVGTTKTTTKTVQFDPTQGIKIIDFTPKFSIGTSTTVSLTLSEDALCKISKNKEFLSEFNNLSQTLSGSGVQRTFQASGLLEGENTFFVYCQRGNNVFEDSFKLLFDKEGPRIANFTFVTNGIQSDFLGSTKRIGYELEAISKIGIDKLFFFVRFNDSEIKEFERSSEEGSLSGNFEGAQEVRVLASDRFGRNSTALTKTILFDLEAPFLSITPIGDEITITCSDSQSGCSKVFYGFKEFGANCVAQIKLENTTIKKGELPVICARALDKVGNVKEEELLLELPVIDDDLNNVPNRTNTSFPTFPNNEDEGTPIVDDTEDVDPFIPSLPETTDEGGGNLILIAGVSLLLLLILGGGGYGAYKKGYLNKQLEKMGIHVKSTNESGNEYYTNPHNFEEDKEEEPRRTETTSVYDHHLKDLNTFIDETLNKKRKSFDAFEDEKTKEKRESLFEENSHKKKTSDELEFDEFYKHSKQEHHRKIHENKKLETDKKVKEEAGKFEDYHKKKKESDKKEEGTSEK